MAADTKEMNDKAADAEGDDDEARDETPAKGERAEKPVKPDYAGPSTAARASGPGFFTIYKKGQGYWTRMGTVMGAGLLGALTAYTIYEKHPQFHMQARVAIGIAVGFVVLYSLLVWRLMNKPANADFLIATDSEMKKVNWTSRRELIGSTKVVILFMFLIGLVLFLIDMIFWVLFWAIGVLAFPPFSTGGK